MDNCVVWICPIPHNPAIRGGGENIGEIADVVLKALSCLVVVVADGWALRVL